MKYTDQELLGAIRSSNVLERDKAFRDLYLDAALRQFAFTYVKNHGGSPDDAEDVFQDAVVVFDRKVREGHFQGKSSVKTYFNGIIKWHWTTNKRKIKPAAELNEARIDLEADSPEARFFEGERRELLEKAIAALDETCREVLRLYLLDFSVKEIEELTDFKTPVKKQGYRCRERLREHLLKHPILLKALQLSVKDE